MPLLPPLAAYVGQLDFQHIAPEREEKLAPLISYIVATIRAQKPVLLNFICTHNSRRSHLGQIWAAVAAHVHGIGPVTTYSGGTEATAFNPRAVDAVKRAGFSVESTGEDNPHYHVVFSGNAPALECFSKCYDDPFNPTSDFAAVMTCTDADQNCPAIIGATRISLPYRDPKEADDTPQEAERYDERCRQVATEQLYVFARVAEALGLKSEVAPF